MLDCYTFLGFDGFCKHEPGDQVILPLFFVNDFNF